MRAIEQENPSVGETDSFSLYLKSLGNPSVYTREEEQKVFRQYDSGLALVEAIVTSDSFHKNPIPFIPIIQTSIDLTKEVFDSIVLHNQGLVISIAKRSRVDLPMLDKVQNGNLGLFIAIDKFDPSRGNKFSTYATPEIKVTIKNLSNDQSLNVRIPRGRLDQYSKLNKFQNRFLQGNGRWPTAEECMESLEWRKITFGVVAQDSTINSRVSSMDIPLSDETDSISFGDNVSDPVLDGKHSIEHFLYDKDGNNLQIQKIAIALKSISESTESEHKWVSAYMEYVLFPEISFKNLAIKYSCSINELNQNLVNIQNKLHEKIGASVSGLDNYQKMQRRMLKIPKSSYQEKESEIDMGVLNAVKVSMRNGERKVNIYIEYNNNENTTLQSIGDRYGVSRERVRQIIADVEQAMQSLPRLK